jgi:hypothetical protein
MELSKECRKIGAWLEEFTAENAEIAKDDKGKSKASNLRGTPDNGAAFEIIP